MLDCLRRWMSASISDGSVFGMSSRLAIVGRLGRSLGQTPTSAKSESDRIPFCHAVPPQGDENLALRQQLSVINRKIHRPQLHRRDQFFWAILSQLCKNWREVLIIVKPQTVIK